MTRINSMVLHGFKSFAKRTELIFGDQFNCILGANGSGKSNIGDALCFVLGRLSSKSMRAEKASNLIYNGGKTKKPMKQAEVSLFFDNSNKTFPTDDPYVKITRIIKQDGASVYKINDEKRTRQQILELMSIARIDPDGFNIVLQGDIVRFTEMPPDDRRQIIEEISGISIYEERKQKALHELENVGQKLKEAEIILAERNAHLKELKKDRDQALKFKELEGKIKENKASYLYIQIERAEKQKNELSEKISDRQGKINELNEKINAVKKEIQEKKAQIEGINKEIEEKGEKEQVALNREVEMLKTKLAVDKTRMESYRGEIDKIILRKKQLLSEVEEIGKQIALLKQKKSELEKTRKEKDAELAKTEDKIQGFKKANSIDAAAEIEKQIDDLDKNAESLQQKIDECRKKQQDLLRTKDSLEYQINTINEKIQKVAEVEKVNKAQLDGLKKIKDDFKKAVLELNKRLTDDSRFARELGDKRARYESSQAELAKLEARKASISENIAGNLAIKEIIKHKERVRGIYGTLAELGEVDSKYALAMEVAAGPRMQSIVVADDKVAADCIKYLREHQFGTATFLPLNKIRSRHLEKSQEKLLNTNGVCGLALDLVSFDKKYEKAFEYAFGDTLVIDDIESARKIGVGVVRMVTLAGDLVETSGAMQGGYRHKRRFGFQEKDVADELKKVKNVVEMLEAEIAELNSSRKENEDLIEKLRARKAELEGEIIKQEKSLHLETGDLDLTLKAKETLEGEIEKANSDIENIVGEISKINKELADTKIKKQQLRAKVSEIRNPALLAELNAFEEKRAKLKEESVKLEAEMHNVDTEMNDMKLPEKEKLGELMKQQEKELEGFKQQISKLDDRVKSDTSLLKEKEDAAQEFYAKYKGLFATRSKIGDVIQKEEIKVDEFREKSKEIEIGMNEFVLKNAEVSGKLAGLNEEFKQYEGIPINKEKSEDELRGEINKFERMVADIGGVNLRALEIYDEIEKEYNSLFEKKNKLNTEREDVLKMMDEIEGKKKELFMKTYNEVGKNFQKIFSELSTKGEASLELENPDKPLEAGLSIKVRITGTKFLDIRSLSGGEKTMTALAFIFAIQEYEPHSFYIMDEVDAALDKHNSEKLSKLIRQYSSKAQYITISHNDAIISEADNLYGVSMDEHGVSNVTTVKL